MNGSVIRKKQQVLTWLICGLAVALLTMPLSTGAAPAGEVTLSGDARLRYIIKDNYKFGNGDSGTIDTFDSRVRIVFNAQSSGGAYAKARLRTDTTWGETTSITPWIDIAYLGIPIGPTVVEGGLMKSNITRFFEWDQSADQATLQWDMFDLNWQAIFRMVNEAQFSNYDIDRLNDNDQNDFGLVARKRFLENWNFLAAFLYSDDQRDEYTSGEYIPAATGFFWSLHLDGKYRGLALETELAFKGAQTRQSRDETGQVINQDNVDQGDGWGWYAEFQYPLGNFTPILNIGLTIDGYEADNDFGWLMIGNSNNEPIALIAQVGGYGDWFWIAPSLSYRMNERLSATGNLVLASVDIKYNPADADLEVASLIEISGELTYTISDGASFAWKAGFLIPDLEGTYLGEEARQETAFGTYARLQIQF